jgi:hypothetical protein
MVLLESIDDRRSVRTSWRLVCFPLCGTPIHSASASNNCLNGVMSPASNALNPCRTSS